MRRIYTDPEIYELAQEALNGMCFYVQQTLGIEDGGNASMFWSGREDLIWDYVENEVIMSGNSTEKFFKKWQETRQFAPDLAKALPNTEPEEPTSALIYEHDLYIELTNQKDAQYMLTIENWSEATNDLESLERKLYEWALRNGYFD